MLVDGLIASAAPDVLVPEARRLRLVVLVHMPLGDGPPGTRRSLTPAPRERAVLSSAARPSSRPARGPGDRLLDIYPLPPDQIHVAEPGVDAATLAPGTAARSNCSASQR